MILRKFFALFIFEVESLEQKVYNISNLLEMEKKIWIRVEMIK